MCLVCRLIMPIIRSSRVLYRWLLPVVFGALVFKLSVWCGAESYVSGLRADYAHHQELESIIQVAAACGICSSSLQPRHITQTHWRFISTY